MASDDIDVSRPLRPSDGQGALFDIGPNWKEYWWGMPSFVHGDARPGKAITVNFYSIDNYRDFLNRLGLKMSDQADTMWWPEENRLNGAYLYDGPKVTSKYPICIPSKGRADCQSTGMALDQLGLQYMFFVEESEAPQYVDAIGQSRVVVMPFHDLGLGSIPARNFIWDWTSERGHQRHWVVDDNIVSFARCNNNRRLRVRSGSMFRAMEDFVDRYENVDIAGPHHLGFVKDREPSITPVLWNSRIYSCILVSNSLRHRWRGRYNEDTDLCLRTLKDGRCTALFRSLLMNKGATVGVRNSKPMKGGNADNVYNTGDHRRAFAESLREQHPDIVEVVWKFNRWHHQVDYSGFTQKPILRAGVTRIEADNEYGMKLVETACRFDEPSADAELEQIEMPVDEPDQPAPDWNLADSKQADLF